MHGASRGERNEPITRIAKRRFSGGHWLAAAGLLLVCAMPIADALAHGEKAQEAFLRMRSIHWVDTKIGPIDLSVNDLIEVSGKFMPSNHWPGHVPTPTTAFLNIGVPGPSFVRLESWVNGVNMVNSTAFDLGGAYDYKVVLKARRPGRYHVHPLINVLDAGPLIGPGIWVEVSGRFEDYKHEVTTITGETVDLETYNLATVFGWHALWFAAGAAWLIYWIFFKGRQLLPRYRRVRELGDDADIMISPFDRKLALGVMVATLLVVTYGFFSTDAKYPNSIPLQTGQIKVPPLPAADPLVEVEFDNANYQIPGRSLTVNLTVTNTGDKTVEVGEFMTANVRFINAAVRDITPADEDDLIAPNGLHVTGGAIEPGETKQISIRAEDAMWETQRLARLIYDPDSRFAGLVYFYDSDGERQILEVSGPLLPTFDEL